MIELLAKHRRIARGDLDEVRSRLAEVFCPHVLEPKQRWVSSAVRVNYATFGALGFCFTRYGGKVSIRPRHMETFFAVQIPVTGEVVVRTGRTEILSTNRLASVPDPDSDLSMQTGGGDSHLVVLIKRSAVERQLRRLLGCQPNRRLRFDHSMDLSTTEARSWLATVKTLVSDLDGAETMRHPVLQNHMEKLLLTQLLVAQPNTFSAQLRAEAAPAPPPAIRRAREIILENPRSPLTVDVLAKSVGISVRSLQESFRRSLGTSPTAMMREQRMAGVRRDLMDADPRRATVSQIASDWGFYHLGRFSIQYKERWGESPSESLRNPPRSTGALRHRGRPDRA